MHTHLSKPLTGKAITLCISLKLKINIYHVLGSLGHILLPQHLILFPPLLHYLFRCILSIVSASDVTPTDRWLNVWCIWHTYLETLQECWSHRRIGWIIQDIRGTCVSRSLTFRLETKIQTPSRKKKAVVFTTVTTNAYQGQLYAGFSKVCEIFKVRSIESLKYVQEFHTAIVATFPRPEMWRWTKRTEIGCLTCRSNGLMGGPWQIKAAIYSRPSAVSLKVWLSETILSIEMRYAVL